jgi:uncharacterized protein (TIGR00106 family)
MSALLNFAIFPTDKGTSVSEYVSKVIKMIKDKKYSYQLTSMGTIVETATVDEALEVILESYKILEKFSDRVYITATIDIRKNSDNRILSKIESIKNKIDL